MKVTFAAAASGRSYFEKFLAGLAIQDRAAILAVLQDVQLHGLQAKGCEFRQLKGKLWEIKIRAPTGGYRFLYVLLTSEHLHILHSKKKQGQRAPARELEIAIRRLKEILNEK